jgi:high-affinity nickel-transport protein
MFYEHGVYNLSTHMESLSLDLSGLAFMMLLGLRHGLDPDHIAVIDGITLRNFQERPSFARWAGALFALGHGTVVTLVAVIVASLSQSFALPLRMSQVIDWFPVVLLLFVGTLNLISLLRNDATTHSIKGWRYALLPRRLRESATPMGIFLVGLLFGLVFDTTTQAAAWGMVASSTAGVAGALLIGVVFSLGMVTADTLDGFVLTSLLQKTSGTSAMQQYRYWLSWFIVVIAYGVAAYSILTYFQPALELSEFSYSLSGLGFFFCIISLYSWIWWRYRPAQQT